MGSARQELSEPPSATDARPRRAARSARTPPRVPALRLRTAMLGPERLLRRLVKPISRRVRDPLPGLSGEVKQLRLSQIELTRRVAWLEETLRRGEPPPRSERVHESPAWEARESPSISVMTAVYEHERYVTDALESLAGSTFSDVELIVVDDGSGDRSGERVRSWMEAHPELPALLLRHPVNRGLPVARNTALAEARGERVLVLDADNEVYPAGIERLSRALDEDPEAAFAYGILETFDERGRRGFRGIRGWDVRRLRAGNYIDALALVRRSVLLELGGFVTDLRLYGWEDYELWCAIAAAGLRGAHVREVVGRYRLGGASMISTTNLSEREARAVLAERHPALFRPRGG
jgi:Glycosyl transferase family 2